MKQLTWLDKVRMESEDHPKYKYWKKPLRFRSVMKHDLFIRTYSKDLPWLAYCLRSIEKFAKGFNDIVITIPQEQRNLLDKFNLTKEHISIVPNYKNDYLGQQVSKMNAFKYSSADTVTFMDSDCIFTREIRPEYLFQDGKPIVLKTHYSKVGDAICWKEPTERALGAEVEYEYMRRHPMTFYTKDIEAANKHIEKTKQVTADQYILSQKTFSEFNYLGAYINKYKSDKYVFVDTNIPTVDTSAGQVNSFHQEFVKQYWSWGGLTEEIKKDLEDKLR